MLNTLLFDFLLNGMLAIIGGKVKKTKLRHKNRLVAFRFNEKLIFKKHISMQQPLVLIFTSSWLFKLFEAMKLEMPGL